MNPPSSLITYPLSEKILIVEDEPALQETLVYNLRRQGYTTEIAGDGYAALETARRFLPDLDGMVRCHRPPPLRGRLTDAERLKQRFHVERGNESAISRTR